MSRTAESASAEAPARGGLVLAALILSAAVANLNLAVANVALPSIGQAFDASQTQLNLIAVGYSLGLAASVLYLGAVGDRYGRKLLLLLGLVLSVPACLMAAYAPNPGFLFLARVVGGLSAGLAFPTTLDGVYAVVTNADLPEADEDDRPLVGHRGRDLRPRAAGRGLPPPGLLVGLGLPGDPAADRRRLRHGMGPRSRARQRDE